MVLQYRRFRLTSEERRQLAHAPQQEPPSFRVGQRAKPFEHEATIEPRQR